MAELEKQFKESGGIFQEYKIADLFQSENGNTDIQQKHLNGQGEYVVSAGEQNFGIVGKTDVAAKIFPKNTITVDMFGNVVYRDFPYKMVTHARVFSLKPKVNYTQQILLYIANTMKFLNQKFSYSNMASWEKIKKQELSIQLPVFNNQINFDYMEKYIHLIENEKQEQLNVFFKDNHLTTDVLTPAEEKALNDFGQNKITFTEYQIGDLFEKVQTQKLNFKVKDLPSFPKTGFDLPALTSGALNQGLSCYVPKEKATVLNNVISVAANGSAGMMFYQSDDFTILQDSYAIKCTKKDLSSQQYLYCLSALQKSVTGYFDWTNKASWEKVKIKTVSLPTQGGQIDFDFMENYMRAVQKQVMAPVLQWCASRNETVAQGQVGNINHP